MRVRRERGADKPATRLAIAGVASIVGPSGRGLAAGAATAAAAALAAAGGAFVRLVVVALDADHREDDDRRGFPRADRSARARRAPLLGKPNDQPHIASPNRALSGPPQRTQLRDIGTPPRLTVC